MANLAALLQTDPTSTGVAIGSNVSLIVEIVLPEVESSIYGVAVYGTDLYSDLTWRDMSPYVRGVEFTRGGFPGTRPQVGEMRITVASTDGEFSPTADPSDAFEGSPTYFGPGSIVRVGVMVSTTWHPLFTGVVRSWPQATAGAGADKWIDVQVGETVGLLSLVDELALSAPVGSGDDCKERVQRLLTAANWQYGFLDATPPSTGFQSTKMARNRLAECYLTVDSIDWVFRSDRTGAAMIAAKPDGTGSATALGEDHIVADSFVPANDDEQLVNAVTLSIAGGSEITVTDDVSIGRRGRRTYSRNDLITSTSTHLSSIAQDIIDRTSQTIRPVSLTHFVPASTDPDYEILWTADVGDLFDITVFGVTYSAYALCFVTHRITPGNPTRPVWFVDAMFEATPESDWSA